MALPPAPWDVVLGNTPGGELIVVPGPQGEQGLPGAAGAAGTPGATGPVAAPLAKYLLDQADAGLVNGIVIPRGLGPDRVQNPAKATDDFMITAVSGYNSALWTLHNSGTGTVLADSLGGVCFSLKDESKWVWIQQACGVVYDFVAKVAIGVGEGDTAVYAGIGLVVPGDISAGNPYFQVHTIGWNGGNAFFFRDEGFADIDRSNLVFTQTGLPQNRPQGWWYLRVRSVAGGQEYLVSENGLTWQSLGTRVFPGPVGAVRLQAYFHGASNPAPIYFQSFRSLI